MRCQRQFLHQHRQRNRRWGVFDEMEHGLQSVEDAPSWIKLSIPMQDSWLLRTRTNGSKLCQDEQQGAVEASMWCRWAYPLCVTFEIRMGENKWLLDCPPLLATVSLNQTFDLWCWQGLWLYTEVLWKGMLTQMESERKAFWKKSCSIVSVTTHRARLNSWLKSRHSEICLDSWEIPLVPVKGSLIFNRLAPLLDEIAGDVLMPIQRVFEKERKFSPPSTV